MRVVLTPDQMRAMEQRYFNETGVPSLDLMETAAKQLADRLYCRSDGGRVYIACGTGGNGGDGLAAARILRSRGVEAEILLPEPPKSDDAKKNLERAREAGVPVHGAEAFEALPEPELWCDALFGIGLTRAPAGEAARLIGRMNASAAPVVAADVPSGLDARTGCAHPACVRAVETVTFQCLKTGLVLADGLDCCGEVTTVDIGIPEALLPGDAARLIEPEDVARLLKPRPRNMHKGVAGQLLLVAGSFGMAGAAAIAATAALRMGVGLVTIACPGSIVPILQTLAPCATCLPMPEYDGALSAEAAGPIKDALFGKTAVAVGCGLSRHASKEVVRVVLESGLPAAIDADALNIISATPELRALLGPRHVLTPHPGEAARLLGRASSDPFTGARQLRELGATAILKGASSVIAGEGCYISAAGTQGMARGGSGDALLGVLGALLAEGVNPCVPEAERLTVAAALACQIHGLAGEAAAAAHTARAMTSMDLAHSLEKVFCAYGG